MLQPNPDVLGLRIGMGANFNLRTFPSLNLILPHATGQKQNDGQAVLLAAKKSRAPLRLKRKILQHESRVKFEPCATIQLPLWCRPSVEYLPTEILGPSIGDIHGQAEAV